MSRAVVTHGADAVGATVASVTLLGEDQHTVGLVALSGGIAGDEETWGTFPLSCWTPSAEIIRTGRRILVTGAPAITDRFRDMPARRAETVVTLPLKGGRGDRGDRPLLHRAAHAGRGRGGVPRHPGQRVRPEPGPDRRPARRRPPDRQAEFLAQAATELASSLDYEGTLASVAQLAVPTFADWCAIDVVDDGRLRRLAVAHVDPAKVRLAHELAERYPPDPDAPHGAWQVIRTGRSELIAEITDEMLTRGPSTGAPAIARALHLRSAVTVPLVARGTGCWGCSPGSRRSRSGATPRTTWRWPRSWPSGRRSRSTTPSCTARRWRRGAAAARRTARTRCRASTAGSSATTTALRVAPTSAATSTTRSSSTTAGC